MSFFYNTEDIVAELLKYQNPDGGLGDGFEPDVLLPLKSQDFCGDHDSLNISLLLNSL